MGVGSASAKRDATAIQRGRNARCCRNPFLADDRSSPCVRQPTTALGADRSRSPATSCSDSPARSAATRPADFPAGRLALASSRAASGERMGTAASTGGRPASAARPRQSCQTACGSRRGGASSGGLLLVGVRECGARSVRRGWPSRSRTDERLPRVEGEGGARRAVVKCSLSHRLDRPPARIAFARNGTLAGEFSAFNERRMSYEAGLDESLAFGWVASWTCSNQRLELRRREGVHLRRARLFVSLPSLPQPRGPAHDASLRNDKKENLSSGERRELVRLSRRVSKRSQLPAAFAHLLHDASLPLAEGDAVRWGTVSFAAGAHERQRTHWRFSFLWMYSISIFRRPLSLSSSPPVPGPPSAALSAGPPGATRPAGTAFRGFFFGRPLPSSSSSSSSDCVAFGSNWTIGCVETLDCAYSAPTRCRGGGRLDSPGPPMYGPVWESGGERGAGDGGSRLNPSEWGELSVSWMDIAVARGGAGLASRLRSARGGSLLGRRRWCGPRAGVVSVGVDVEVRCRPAVSGPALIVETFESGSRGRLRSNAEGTTSATITTLFKKPPGVSDDAAFAGGLERHQVAATIGGARRWLKWRRRGRAEGRQPDWTAIEFEGCVLQYLDPAGERSRGGVVPSCSVEGPTFSHPSISGEQGIQIGPCAKAHGIGSCSRVDEGPMEGRRDRRVRGVR